MIPRSDVVAAYRLILGREPENEQVIEGWMQAENLEILRQSFLSGQEFREKLKSRGLFSSVATVGRNIYGPKMQLDLAISRVQFKKMLKEVAQTWSRLGKTEPHWSVLTSEHFKQDKIASTEEEFYRTGGSEVRMIQSYFDRAGENIDAVQSVLELGCGVGRITSHLAMTFPQVVGLDISAAHLRVAQRHFDQIGVQNVRLTQLAAIETIDRLSDFDLFFSIISLQHSAPPIIDALLQRVMTKAKPGAYLLFQVPTYHPSYSFSIEAYGKQGHPNMEVHPLPQRRVFELLRETGFDLIEVQEDNLTGDPQFTSHTFFARKSVLEIQSQRRRGSPIARVRRILGF